MAEILKEEMKKVEGTLVRGKFDGLRKTTKGEDLMVLTLVENTGEEKPNFYSLTFFGAECEKAKILNEKYLHSIVEVSGKCETKKTEKGNIRMSFFNPSLKIIQIGSTGIELPDVPPSEPPRFEPKQEAPTEAPTEEPEKIELPDEKKDFSNEHLPF